MPSRERAAIYRTVGQAFHHMDISLERLKELVEIFRPHHPEMADQLEAIATAIIFAEDTFEQFCQVAWRKTRDQIETYRT